MLRTHVNAARRAMRLGGLALCVLSFLPIAGGASAGTIYRCAGAGGAVAFQSTSCAAQSTQTAMAVAGQPLIDAQAPAAALPAMRSAHSSRGSLRQSREHLRARRGSRRGQGLTLKATSWECRAADGEVFYRHTRCPHSVPGDGVMRSTGKYVIRRGRGKRGSVRDAWSAVPVHARKVSRALACRQINAVAAVDRDGSARDERASAYEHDVGRDPCDGY